MTHDVKTLRGLSLDEWAQHKQEVFLRALPHPVVDIDRVFIAIDGRRETFFYEGSPLVTFQNDMRECYADDPKGRWVVDLSYWFSPAMDHARGVAHYESHGERRGGGIAV